ncbi:hypothetical protein FAM21838_02483 [Lentilactobacillus parabuchneri]|nr:hypothetical protein FAM21838_02483 [Lentilactobacillus parabuchneri]
MNGNSVSWEKSQILSVVELQALMFLNTGTVILIGTHPLKSVTRFISMKVKKRSLDLVYKKVQLIYYQWEQCSLHHVQVLETLLFLQKKGVLIKAFNQLFHTKTCLIAILYFLELLN